MKDLTQEKLKEYLHYNELTGIFTWIKRPQRSHIIVGEEAGSVTGTRPYRTISLFGIRSQAHRLVFFMLKASGQTQHLGYHIDFFEACCARLSANVSYGFHENHGRAV